LITYFLGKKYWGLLISWVKSTGEYLFPGKNYSGSTSFQGNYFLAVTGAAIMTIMYPGKGNTFSF